MKLKTLEDLEKQYSMNYPIEKSGYSVFIDELKQEAIKWVKELQKENTTLNIAKEDILMEFFNITEEDLK